MKSVYGLALVYACYLCLAFGVVPGCGRTVLDGELDASPGEDASFGDGASQDAPADNGPRPDASPDATTDAAADVAADARPRDAVVDVAPDVPRDAPVPPDANGCSPLASCGGACVNLDTSPANCGACGHACGPAAPDCLNGACVLSCVAAGDGGPALTDCNGACVDL
ncbi:MAG: hypothetical protein JOZ69_20115, partial [Myxococcales bacterium]|nr:hypothetical protein [Myxococcales bacterium]